MATTGNYKSADDTEALLAYLDTRDEVAGRQMGVGGFCMGGGMGLPAVGTDRDRFAAAVSFHGGNLATHTPTSSHLFAPRLQAALVLARSAEKEQLKAQQVAMDKYEERLRANLAALQPGDAQHTRPLRLLEA